MWDDKNFEELFHEKRPGWHHALWRDIRCAVYLGSIIWRNITLGRAVRKKYLACKASGEPFWLDKGNEGEAS